MCAGRRNVYDFLFRKAIHFQSTEFARRADNQRSAGLPGGLADSNKAVWLANSLLEVQPSKEGKNLFSCSKKVNDYLKMTVMGDTLKILLDYSLDQLPQEFKKSKFMGMNIGDMRLDMTQDVECIINDINSQNIGFKHLEKDSLSIDTSNSIVVDSCDFAALQVIRSGGNVEWDY